MLRFPARTQSPQTLAETAPKKRMKINIQEIENVSKLNPFERYKYFIKKLADLEIFYTLKDENNNYVISELENHQLFPIWNFKEFAELCLIEEWKNFKIKELSLDDLQDEIIDLVSNENYLLNVFPIGLKTGFVVDLEEFISDLKEESDKY